MHILNESVAGLKFRKLSQCQNLLFRDQDVSCLWNRTLQKKLQDVAILKMPVIFGSAKTQVDPGTCFQVQYSSGGLNAQAYHIKVLLADRGWRSRFKLDVCDMLLTAIDIQHNCPPVWVAVAECGQQTDR